MPKQKKKKNSEEIITLWTTLKEKLLKTLTELKATWASLTHQLETISPFREQLHQIAENARELNYLRSLETSLKARNLENQQYETRLRQEEEKNNRLGKKLEVVRGLMSEGKVELLKSLLHQGKL